jgi:hypothetical protein
VGTGLRNTTRNTTRSNSPPEELGRADVPASRSSRGVRLHRALSSAQKPMDGAPPAKRAKAAAAPGAEEQRELADFFGQTDPPAVRACAPARFHTHRLVTRAGVLREPAGAWGRTCACGALLACAFCCQMDDHAG